MKNYIAALILTISILGFSSSADAAWGDFDTTFGFLGAAIDGNVTDHHPYAVALQADGKILVTGYKTVGGKKRFFLRRYLSNGQIDTSFGNNGSAVSYALIDANADYYGYRIVVQANGRIAIAGVGDQLPVIWRFLSTGYADTSIGQGGMKTFSTFENAAPRIATNANVLYVGLIEQGYTSTVVLKFNSNGTQDLSFGTSGKAITDAGNVFSLAVDPTSGNILLSGRRRSDPNDYGIERFLTTGVLDSSFNHWNATYSEWQGSYPSEFVRLANGEFVLNERWANISGGITFGANIVRLSSNGLFTSRSQYEPDGVIPLGSPEGDCPDLNAQQSDGRVILKGWNNDALFRFSTNFSTTHTMDCDSYASMDPGTQTPAVLQSDDKMVGGGTYGGYITLVRTLP